MADAMPRSLLTTKRILCERTLSLEKYQKSHSKWILRGLHSITCTCTVQPTKSQQKVEQWEKYSDFRPPEPGSAHPQTALFRTFQRRSMGQIGEVEKNPDFLEPRKASEPISSP